MTDRLPVHDDDLVELLREACARHDAAPAFVVEGAKAAFDLRSLDEELAALTNDTLLDTPLVGVRGQTSRQLTFTSGDLAVEVDIDAWGVVGHVSSDAARDVEIQTPSTSISCVVDDIGRFFGEAPPPGPFRLRLHLATSRFVVTEWVNR